MFIYPGCFTLDILEVITCDSSNVGVDPLENPAAAAAAAAATAAAAANT